MSCEDCENTNGAFSEAGMWRKIGEFETAMRAEQKQEQRKTKRARKLAKEVTLDQELHSKGWRNPVLDETFPRDYDTRSESGRSDNFAIGQKDVGSMLGAKIEYVGTLSQEDKDFVQSKFGERIGCNSCVDMVIKFSNGMWFTRENIIFTK
jgi:ribosomal protein S27E